MSFIIDNYSVVSNGTGTLVSSNGSTIIIPLPLSASIRIMTVCVCYMEGDATLVYDLGDGWQIVCAEYDPANNFGMFMAVMYRHQEFAIASPVGFQLPSSCAYTIQCYGWSIPTPACADMANISRHNAWFNDPASSTTITCPGITPSNSSGIFLFGLGYNNGGVPTSIGSITGVSERFDTGQASPPHGIGLEYVVPSRNTALSMSPVSGILAAAATKRAGIGCFIPIVHNNTPMRRRYLTSRRLG